MGDTIHYRDVPRDRWEKAFGKFDPEAFKKAVREQKTKKKKAPKGEKSPVIHDDRNYLGYDYGLGVELKGRAHFKQVLKDKGLRVV